MEILIVKTSAIGDVIQAFPTLAYLRQKFPDAKIDWVVEKSASALIQAHPDVREILVLNTKTWRKNLFSKTTRHEIRSFCKNLRCKKYDLLLDLQGNSKSGLVTLLAKAKQKVGFSSRAVPEKPNILATTHRYTPPKNLPAREQALFLAQRHLNDFSFRGAPLKLKLTSDEEHKLRTLVTEAPTLMVCPGSKWKNKQLDEATLKALLQKIDARFSPNFLFIWSSPEEKTLADSLAAQFPKSQSLGDLSLPLIQNLMSRTDGILAVDSALLHLSATTQTPTFSIFGPSSSTFYKPPGEGHTALQGSCPYGKTFQKRCPILRSCPTAACIRNLSAEEIFAAFAPWWNNLTKTPR